MIEKEVNNKAGGPLQGIRVLDFSRLYPGPLGTMLLADMGAEVIKIEDPAQPDYVRNFPPFIKTESAAYLAFNRSKKSLALSCREEEGKKIFYDLVKTADVVVEQFRPGVMAGMGLGYGQACKKNPKIIYVSLTGYGQQGPYADHAGHDLNYIGYAGILGLTLSDDLEPTLPGPQMADVAGGAYMLVIACLSALFARGRSGKGQQVDLSMLDGVLPLMTLQMAQYWAAPEALKDERLPLSGGLASYGTYRCSDGKFVALAALEPKFWEKFCDWVEKPLWKDKIYAMGAECRQLKKDVGSLFQTRPRDEWVQESARRDICLTPVLGLDEIEKDPHLQQREMFITQPHPCCGNIKGIGVPIKFKGTPAVVQSPPPILGQDTAAVLEDLGYSPDRIERLHFDKVIFDDSCGNRNSEKNTI
ncbi:MAG: CaiB/BaiF CoA-transferase family protein [Desulfobacterales bacterium]|nr:CaiB/BaiF CoA-transferase family protein [Desulfobacterales bacterium]